MRKWLDINTIFADKLSLQRLMVKDAVFVIPFAVCTYANIKLSNILIWFYKMIIVFSNMIYFVKWSPVTISSEKKVKGEFWDKTITLMIINIMCRQ